MNFPSLASYIRRYRVALSVHARRRCVFPVFYLPSYLAAVDTSASSNARPDSFLSSPSPSFSDGASGIVIEVERLSCSYAARATCKNDQPRATTVKQEVCFTPLPSFLLLTARSRCSVDGSRKGTAASLIRRKKKKKKVLSSTFFSRNCRNLEASFTFYAILFIILLYIPIGQSIT